MFQTFNWIDLLFLILLIYFVATNKGFIDTFYEIISFIVALFVSYKTYFIFGKFININFSLPNGIANALGFFVSWFIIEIFSFSIYALFFSRVFAKIRNQTFNIYLGYLAGFFHFLIVFLFLTSFVFILPLRPQIKKDIIDSVSGHYFVNLSHNLEIKLNSVFNQAVMETINFLTIKPDSKETVSLNFTVKDNLLSSDQTSENIMFKLINQEREKRGLKTLKENNNLKKDAQSYAKEMFELGFFSHTSTLDNSTPADRASRMNIDYEIIGENLAYAPDVYMAHQGLMNSPGHRANILSVDYSRVGIGIIDAGVYGKMFVQEFAD